MLSAWNDTASRDRIIGFVEAAANEADAGYIAPAQRIAVFDNDGTLWSEKPVYFQLYFVIDRARALAAADPGWASSPARKAAAEGDLEGLAATGREGLVDVVTATHSGMTTEEFAELASAWMQAARHPETGKRFDRMVFQPMLELLDYLRSRGFKVYIVSGGGIDFIRTFAEKTYGVPPENVVGSTGEMAYLEQAGSRDVMKQPGIALIDDEAGKPVGIAQHIGQRPVLACGNSDGDFEMVEWVTSGPGPRLAVLIHHTDADREWAYDRTSATGRLDRALDAAADRGWIVVDMAKDWNRIWRQ